MSGGEAWAIVEPSMNSTIECTIDCGCTTTSMRSYGDVEEQVRLDDLEALVHEGRRVRRDDGPHVPGGVRERLGRGDRRASSARSRPRNGPPDAVSTSRRTSSCAPERSACAIAECSESTGTIWPGARERAVTRSPPTISDSLLASASVRAALERRERRRQADRAGDAVEHDVGLDVAHELHGLVDAERGVLDPELRRLRLEQRAVRAGREAHDLEAPRVRPDDLESLGADRAG